MKYLLLFFLIPTSYAISNGDLVGSQDPAAKSQVMLVSTMANGKQKTCSGTIISSGCVLTARHCVEDIIASSIGFSRNIDDLPEQNITEADKRFLHPTADIAILKFSNGLPQGYRSAVLGEQGITLAKSTAVMAYGYSARKPYGTDFGVLRKFSTKLKDLNSNVLHVPGPTTQKIPSTYKGLIEGDSGGGMLSQGHVVGVNSGLSYKMGIGAAVRIQKYLPWVKTYCRIKE